MKSKQIAGIALVLAVVCAGVGIYRYIQERNAGREYDDLREEVRLDEGTDANGADTADIIMEEGQAGSETAEEPEIPIDFQALQKLNPDVYAWITVAGTAVDYPIVQSSDDNSYYLNHTVEGEESAEGAIFTEDYNRKDFEDPNTVIYGHNMKNGTMFRTLHDFADRSFFDENRDITIYLPDEIRHYKIFAAYLYDSRHLLMSYDFGDKEVFRQYLRGIMEMRDMNAFVDTSMNVTEEDKIITLSTCYKGMDSRRYLVQAVLVSIEK